MVTRSTQGTELAAGACGCKPYSSESGGCWLHSPELDNLWQRLRSSGVKVKLFRRGEGSTRGEQQVPDIMLQNAMLKGHG